MSCVLEKEVNTTTQSHALDVASRHPKAAFRAVTLAKCNVTPHFVYDEIVQILGHLIFKES